MFQLPKTPHRPAAQNRLPPPPRRKRLRDKHSSRSPPRLRGSRVYRHRAPRLGPALTSFAQDASPAIDPDRSLDVSYEITHPSSPLDRYNPTGKTAYNQLMIDCAPSPSKLLSSSTSGNHDQSKRTAMGSGSRGKSIPVSKRGKFAPPEEIDDGVFFSRDPAPSPIAIPAPKPPKESAYTLPPLSFAMDVDALEFSSPYYRLQPDPTAYDPPTDLPRPVYPISPPRRADGPAFAYYIN